MKRLSFKRKPGLIIYVTCGDPDMPASQEIILSAISAGADVIELGVPFSDPVADGPVIQRASERALRNGTSLKDVLRLARHIRSQSEVGLVIFSYLNPILRMGLEHFAAEAHAAGIDGVLVTDLALEESSDYRCHLSRAGLAPIFLVAPTTTDHRLENIARLSQGFIYAVSRTGVTGTQENLTDESRHMVQRIRKYTSLPVAVGFGVSKPDHFRQIGEFADAAVIGSAIVQAIEQNPRSEAVAVANLVESFSSNRPQDAIEPACVPTAPK